MPLNNLIHILHLIILSAGIILIMLAISVHRSHILTFILTLITLCLGMAALAIPLPDESAYVSTLLVTDGYSYFYTGLLFAACIITVILSYSYMRERQCVKEEFYVFLLIATVGSAVLVSSSHLASFFLGLEILSVSLYVLTAYLRSAPIHIEAGIKYLIPAATSTAFLLFGTALIYLRSGSMEFSKITGWAAIAANSVNPLFLTGLVMVLVGIGFKLAVVPFHLWIPDVYEGAPAPVTGFIATVSKGSVFALLLRYFTAINVMNYQPLFFIFAVLAILSMFFGNLLALLQNNVKRVLAYSSIAHIGYLIVAFLASDSMAVAAVSFYLTSYFITTLGAFGVITVLSSKEKDLDNIEGYRGLVFHHPLLAGIFTAMLFSLAGIPLTAGFIGKFYILSAGTNSGLWTLVVILVINSVIGLFYYLRIIAVLYSKATEPENEAKTPVSLFTSGSCFSVVSGVILVALTIMLVWLGIYPGPFIHLIETLATHLS